MATASTRQKNGFYFSANTFRRNLNGDWPFIYPEVQRRQHEAAFRMRSEADTQWFRDANYGLMLHWTSEIAPRHGAPKPYNEAVRDFDLQTFVSQVVRSGAKFVTLTTSHGKMFFPAPLRSLDKILPGRTSERDLVGEVADALNAHGIRLILYYHLGANSDAKWQQASAFFKTDTTDFWNNWTAVIGEAGARYGAKLAGWWFDDGTANYYYRSAPWERLASVAKAGNPKRLICFNPWILPSATEFQDYLAGEGNTDPTLRGGLKPGDHGRISSGAYAGLQASAAIVMEGDWNHTKRDTEIGPPKMKLEQLQSTLSRFQALENVLMFNCEIYQDGTLSPATGTGSGERGQGTISVITAAASFGTHLPMPRRVRIAYEGALYLVMARRNRRNRLNRRRFWIAPV